MLHRFRTFIEENNLVDPASGVLLAVSGGVDSMVMSHLFLQTGCRIGIAHCNFGLRGVDSDMDEQMVADFAGKNKIPFYSVRFQTKDYARMKGISIQMAARELRYEWFGKIRSEKGYQSVAVAHNLNDNIETLLINLVRGTGISGLTGMKVSSNNIIRPLLFATREEIMEYCMANSVVYREDKSNADTKYVRNKIRHLVIPVLKEINPSVETTLSATASRLSGINDIVKEYIAKLREEVSDTTGEIHSFRIRQLKACMDNPSILFELFRPYGLTEALVDDLINIINGKTGSRISTDSHLILRNRDVLAVSPAMRIEKGPWIISKAVELRTVPGVLSAKTSKINREFTIPSDRNISCIDQERLLFPLVVRRWNEGDHFHPLGMDRKKKLSDFFTDLKYSALDKENALILESEGKIVAVLGERIDNRFRITQSSKKALIIKTSPR